MKVQAYIDKAGEYRWRLKAGNNQIIATCGEGYKSKRGLLTALKNMARSGGFRDSELGSAFLIAWVRTKYQGAQRVRHEKRLLNFRGES